jgi:hypothetical protein
MLDKAMLETMSPRTAFATGETDILEKFPCRWVAVRGDVYDWAIYYHRLDRSVAQVQFEGDKVFTAERIRALVPCDDEAFALYRY